jgi:hypothetical protein
MNREVHVRFWERAEVKFLRATRHSRRFRDVRHMSGLRVILCSSLIGPSGQVSIAPSSENLRRCLANEDAVVRFVGCIVCGRRESVTYSITPIYNGGVSAVFT